MTDLSLGVTIAMCGVGFAVILAGIGSAVGIGYPARAAAGVLSEDPSRFGSLFLLVVLPGTQGFYGFVAGFLLIGNIANIQTLAQGWQMFFAALPIAFTGLVSAIFQGKVCAAGVNLAAKKPKEVMKGVIYGAMIETYAVLGLLVTFFLNNLIEF
jgi:V/A-type H+/Na+-transporting ATPase subunit K